MKVRTLRTKLSEHSLSAYNFRLFWFSFFKVQTMRQLLFIISVGETHSWFRIIQFNVQRHTHMNARDSVESNKQSTKYSLSAINERDRNIGVCAVCAEK